LTYVPPKSIKSSSKGYLSDDAEEALQGFRGFLLKANMAARPSTSNKSSKKKGIHVITIFLDIPLPSS